MYEARKKVFSREAGFVTYLFMALADEEDLGSPFLDRPLEVPLCVNFLMSPSV